MMKKLIALILLLLSLIFLLAACNSNAAPDDVKIYSPEEYTALYDKYILAFDVGMIFNSTWDNANEIDAECFMYYYAVEILQSGRSIFGENADGYIPAEELEPFVQSHFDVTTEHLRTNIYYIADKNVYEFGGLGSAWYCDITAAEQKGRLLTIGYDVIGPMDYAGGRGVLVIEINGEDYKYLSNKYKITAQRYLDYPNSMGIVDNKGILMMDSGNGKTTENPELNIRGYSGNELSDIIYYYENVALPELDAQGNADTTKYEDGWYWSGTYWGGKPLTIDIQRRYGADTYVITALYEAKANTNVADNTRSRTFMQPPGLNDFDKLSSLYFWRPYYAGVLGETWSTAENVNVPSLVSLYALNEDFTGNMPETNFPAAAVESYVQKYFDISAVTMRGWNVYDRDKNEYTYTPVEVTTVCDIVSATSYGCDDEGKTKIMITYEIHRSGDDDTVIWGGELTVELSDKGYKYLSNSKYYPIYPITQDTAYLDDITKKYVLPLNPTGPILTKSWASPGDIPADDLVNFCAFNNLLKIPRDGDLYDTFAEFINNYAPAAEVETAIRQYFDVSEKYLRTAQWYNFVDESGKRYDNGYIMLYGFGGGAAKRALNTEQDGNLLKITVGLYGPDDEVNRPAKTGLLTVRLDGDSYHYLSYEFA